MLRILSLACLLAFTPLVVHEIRADDQVHFREARRAHLSGRYVPAMALYENVRDDAFVCAARVYAADCLVMLGRIDDAVVAYNAIIKTCSDSIYRAHAMLELARLYLLQEDRTFDEALMLLQDASSALASGGASLGQAEPDKLTPGDIHPLLDTSAVPATGRRQGVRAATLHAKIKLLQVYAAFMSGKTPQALVALDQLSDIQGHAIGNIQPLIQDLGNDLKQGGFIVPDQAWKAANPAYQRQIYLGLFYVRAGEYQLARDLLETVLKKTADGAGDASDWALAEIGLAVCDLREGQARQAIRRLERFEGLLRTTPTGARGRLLLANVLAGGAQLRKPLQLYGDLATEYGTSATGAQALLAMMQAAANHQDHTTLYRAVDRLQQGHATSQSNAIATRLVAALDPSQLDQIQSGTVLQRVDQPAIAIVDVVNPITHESKSGKIPTTQHKHTIVVCRTKPMPLGSNAWIDHIQPVIPMEQAQPVPANDISYGVVTW